MGALLELADGHDSDGGKREGAGLTYLANRVYRQVRQVDSAFGRQANLGAGNDVQDSVADASKSNDANRSLLQNFLGDGDIEAEGLGDGNAGSEPRR